ncbi:hypothetical protein [Corynebacterium striatum]|uniref:hypothetical protein n=1 Tax=Corynebacterium striatum TaxID=43770 RepID=UPI001A3003F0|nr:hypothetical protein [Corynebacterium striatum]HAT1175447.1 hypothetical protein [Corynebacterium striatum]HAT1327425.1 hypothetical protein [Corynebacterium striatum]HAT1329728.1 hypothetical protein [Corynebacterium striatum]HAT1337282.1 hypothetical protein [Corynebacterium striatum]
MKTFFGLVQALFFLFLFAFLLGGVGIIATQSLGIVTLNQGTVIGVENWLAPVIFTCSTLCAVCAFILNYRPKTDAEKAHVRAHGED